MDSFELYLLLLYMVDIFRNTLFLQVFLYSLLETHTCDKNLPKPREAKKYPQK